MNYIYRCRLKAKSRVGTSALHVFTYKDYVPLKVNNRMQDNSNLTLTGVYSKIGSHLIPQTTSEHKLILHHRKEVTAKKPAQYVMLTTGGKPVYLSSLYPTDLPNTFILETGGQYYHLTMTGTGAEINPLNGSKA